MKTQKRKSVSIRLDEGGQAILSALERAGYSRRTIDSEGLKMLAEAKKICLGVGKKKTPHRHVR